MIGRIPHRSSAALLVLSSSLGCGPPPHAASAHFGGAVLLGTDRVRGGEAYVRGGSDGFQASVGASAQRLERDEVLVVDGPVHQRSWGGGLDLAIRLSLLGVVADEHRLGRWFDVGVSASIGGGLAGVRGSVDGYGHADGGAWIEIGLAPGDHYPALMLEARRSAVAGWDDATLFAVGLAYTTRWVDDEPYRD